MKQYPNQIHFYSIDETLVQFGLLVLIPFNTQIIFALIGVFVINLGIHFWNKKNLFKYLQSIPQLLRLNRIATSIHKEALLSRINPDLAQSIKVIHQVRNRMLFF
jgi:calcineurin-like phosphoesterase